MNTAPITHRYDLTCSAARAFAVYVTRIGEWWHPTYTPREVSVSFAPQPAGCRVDFAHGGWNEGNVADRAKFSEWPVILDRFAALANAAARELA